MPVCLLPGLARCGCAGQSIPGAPAPGSCTSSCRCARRPCSSMRVTPAVVIGTTPRVSLPAPPADRDSWRDTRGPAACTSRGDSSLHPSVESRSPAVSAAHVHSGPPQSPAATASVAPCRACEFSPRDSHGAHAMAQDLLTSTVGLADLPSFTESMHRVLDAQQCDQDARLRTRRANCTSEPGSRSAAKRRGGCEGRVGKLRRCPT